MSKSARIVGLVLLGLAFTVGTALVGWNSSIVAPTTAQAQEPWHHGHLRESMDALRAARIELAEAHHNYGGHRDEAIRAIDAAIYHLDMCIRYDR